MMVNSQPDMQVIGEASDGRTALQLAAELAPDIVVMSRLRLKNTRSPAEWSIAEADLERKIANQEQLTLLDVRERASYAVNH